MQTEFLQFLGTSLASLNELQKHLLTASDTHILTSKAAASLYRKIELARRMLISLMRTLQEHIAHEENDRRDQKNGGGRDKRP